MNEQEHQQQRRRSLILGLKLKNWHFTDVSCCTLHCHLLNEVIRKKFDQSAFVNAIRLCKAGQWECVCVCLPETLRLQCPQMAQRGQCIRLLGPSSLFSPSSHLLQDKEALIKQCAREQNVRRRDCGDSDPHYLSGGEPRTAKLSPTAQNTRPVVGGGNDFRRQKLTGWKWEPSNRMRRRAVVLLHSDREKCSLVLLCIVPLEGKWDAALTARCSRW